MPSATSRLLAVAGGAALAVAAFGFAWELARFGASDASANQHIEQRVRRGVADRELIVSRLADRVAAETALIAAADTSVEGQSPLFQRLADLATSAAAPAVVSATVYAANGPRGAYRVLAWSDGPGEDLMPDRLGGPAAVFVAQRTPGLSLVAVRPIDLNGHRIVVAAETVLAPSARSTSGADLFQLDTSYGPVAVTPGFAGPTEEAGRPGVVFVSAEGGAPLIEARVQPEQVRAGRRGFRTRVLAATAVPLVIGILLVSPRAIDRRRRSRSLPAFVGWSCLAAVMVAGPVIALAWLARLTGGAGAASETLVSLAIFGAVVVLLPGAWWRRGERRFPRLETPRWVLEQAFAGVIVAGVLVTASLSLRGRLDAAHLDQWQFPLFPIEPEALLYLTGLLLIQLAAFWAIAAVLAIMASRWRLTWRRPGRAALAALMWVAPSVIAAFVSEPDLALPRAGLAVAAVAAAIFASVAISFRRYYRRTTQAMRLILLGGALLTPAIVFYPTAWFYVDRTAQAIIENEYAPATAGHTLYLIEELKRAEADIDQMDPGLMAALVTADPPAGGTIPGHAAYQVWSGTHLRQTRLTSAVELYGANRALVSRFALNVPEYLYRALNRTWQGTSCHWDVFSEVDHFGADDRQMLHAERGVCDATGRIIGAVVVHIARDFQTLPFLGSANPYYAVLGAPDATPPAPPLPDLHVVVYGWSFHPVVPSGTVAWPITSEAAARLRADRRGFWLTLASDRTYHVYFSDNREGIYALGYPVPTVIEHLTRLASAAALTGGLFILLLIGTAVYAGLTRRRPAPLRALFDEIRTSFYRKLFLFFVLAAVGPVLMLALAFNAYMKNRNQEDVVSESRSVVTVARRVLDELVPDEPRARLTDDVMVWTGRVLDQDVNLFEGPELIATSQRDLFGSGLLSMRTPAAVYRAIALDRLPHYVAQDPTRRYLVAAAPIPARGRDVVLSVPLALRQREIDLQIYALDRQLLVGAVFVLLLAAGMGASVAGKIADPVSRLTRATRQIAAGQTDVRIVADTADELRRLVDDFNSMAATLGSQRDALARSQQFKAWAEMARQVAHEIKNPLTPIQLSAEHLQRVHEDRHRPLGPAFDQCITTILRQVKLLRQIAGEFANFAGEPTPTFTTVDLPALMEEVLAPYRSGLGSRVTVRIEMPADLPPVRVDRTLVGRAFTNLIENAWQAMPQGGSLAVDARAEGSAVVIMLVDTGVGMDDMAVRRAFEPYFSTKTAGSGLGLANAKRNVELCGGSVAIASAVGSGTTVTVRLPVAPTGGPATA